MAEKKKLSPAKIVGFAVLIFVVGIAGVFVGNMLREYFATSKSSVVTTRVPRSLLKQGMTFPDTEIIDADTRISQTRNLIDDNGSIVLFLDLECPPCINMAVKWQHAIDNEMIEAKQVWGISYHSCEVIQTFQEENNLRFLFFTDSIQTFLTEYEVNRFPLEVIIGSSGRIRSLSYDSESPIDFARLAELLAE